MSEPMSSFAAKKPYHGQITFQWERDERSEPIEIVVCYTLNPYVPATRDSPAEGGDCELWDFQLYKYPKGMDETGSTRAISNKSIVSQFESAIETNDALRIVVEDACRDDAASRLERTDDDE